MSCLVLLNRKRGKRHGSEPRRSNVRRSLGDCCSYEWNDKKGRIHRVDLSTNEERAVRKRDHTAKNEKLVMTSLQ
jgi:hypothetical protein